jgi:trans-2,3-dihydro-3-hydroxyanthranilate isomerase
MVDYHLLDVFTNEPFAGNPLAVCVDQGVADAAMQRVARELNLSETVFVSTDSYPYPTRIFTPSQELPFAGHPTLGTAVLLGTMGHARDGEVVLAEGVGDVRVTLSGEVTGEFRTAKLPELARTVTREEAAAAIGLAVDDLHPDLAPASWDCGLAWPIVAVRDVATLGRTRAMPGTLENVYAVAPEGDAPGDRWRARSFVLGMGIAEDPATGSAVAAFAGFVAALPYDRFVVTQGVEMGRPSELRLTVTREGSSLTEVRVAGEAVVVGRGSLFL